MNATTNSSKHRYSTKRTFVLQLGTDEEPAGCVGRVEHILTGRRSEFHSVDELLAFMHEFVDGGPGPTK